MTRLYGGLLAVILCGTISAAEDIEETKACPLSFSGDANSMRGYYIGLARSNGGISPKKVCVSDIISDYFIQCKQSRPMYQDCSVSEDNLPKDSPILGHFFSDYNEQIKNLQLKISGHRLFFLFLPDLLSGRDEAGKNKKNK